LGKFARHLAPYVKAGKDFSNLRMRIEGLFDGNTIERFSRAKRELDSKNNCDGKSLISLEQFTADCMAGIGVQDSEYMGVFRGVKTIQSDWEYLSSEVPVYRA